MAKLRDLDANLVGHYDVETGGFAFMPDMDGAQGVWFCCPLCSDHYMLCWFTNPRNAPRVPDDADPKPGRWEASGTGLDDLTLNPSVSLDTPLAREHGTCRWHGWVQLGEAK